MKSVTILLAIISGIMHTELSAQNVGIGIDNNIQPVYKLQVNNGDIGLFNTTDNKLYRIGYDATFNYFAIREATGINGTATNRMVFSNGLVGINKTPSYGLDVNGSINSDFNILANGSISAGGNIFTNGGLSAGGDIFAGGGLSVGTNITTGSNSDATIGRDIYVGRNIFVGTDGTDRGVISNYTSSPGSQLKYYTTTYSATAVLGPHGISAEATLGLPSGVFTATPTVTVGNIVSTGGTVGQLYMVLMQVYGCSISTNSCKFRLINTSDGSVNYNITYALSMIGR